MTSQGSAHGRFARAIARRDIFEANVAAKEMGGLSLIDALDYVALVAEVQPDRLEATAIRWHGRLELESDLLSMAEAQLALAALAGLRLAPEETMPLLKAAAAEGAAGSDAEDRLVDEKGAARR